MVTPSLLVQINSSIINLCINQGSVTIHRCCTRELTRREMPVFGIASSTVTRDGDREPGTGSNRPEHCG